MEQLRAGAEKLGLHLGEKELSQFQVFYEELTDWNKRMNLTSITSYEDVQIKHFLDALTVALAWKPESLKSRVIDIGAGAGVPGIPLKIVFPQIRLVLLEATAKKTVFLQHVVEKLRLPDIEIIAGRAEDIAHQASYRGQFNIVLARGLAGQATLVELTLPYCAIGGLVIAHKKGDIQQELKQAEKATAILGGRLKAVMPVTLTEFPDNRVLVVIEKVSPTPGKYPRRAGMPGKNPLV